MTVLCWPNLPAMGVAMLSGFILNLRDIMIINIIIDPRRKLAIDAVHIEPDTKTRVFKMSNSFSVISLTIVAAIDVKNATTIA